MYESIQKTNLEYNETDKVSNTIQNQLQSTKLVLIWQRCHQDWATNRFAGMCISYCGVTMPELWHHIYCQICIICCFIVTMNISWDCQHKLAAHIIGQWPGPLWMGPQFCILLMVTTDVRSVWGRLVVFCVRHTETKYIEKPIILKQK